MIKMFKRITIITIILCTTLLLSSCSKLKSKWDYDKLEYFGVLDMPSLPNKAQYAPSTINGGQKAYLITNRETFDSYAVEVFTYLQSKYGTYLGYIDKEIEERVDGRKTYHIVPSNNLEDYKLEKNGVITYSFVYSKANELKENSCFVDDRTIVLTFYEEEQQKEIKLTEVIFNTIVELEIKMVAYGNFKDIED